VRAQQLLSELSRGQDVETVNQLLALFIALLLDALAVFLVAAAASRRPH